MTARSSSTMRGWRRTAVCIAIGVAALTQAACGGDDKPAQDSAAPGDTAVDTRDADAAPPDAASGVGCCPLGNCGDVTLACVSGACVPRPAAGGCYFDGECAPGERCQGATFCACGATDCEPAPGTCGFGAGCCNGDADCAGGEVCEAGTCRAKPAQGCWRDSHCGAGEVCEGAAPNPCGQAGPDAPGHCALPGVCCLTDAECGGGVCRGARCVEKATAGACWADGECGAGQTCLGEKLCACSPGASDVSACDAPPTPGRCGVAADSCCSKDSDCQGGQWCVAGECAPAPDRAKDECWVDGHCGVGRVCEGATLCGCKDDGCTQSVVGQCRTRTIDCGADADCPTAMRCAVPDQSLCPDEAAPTRGVCVAQVDGGCWQKADCHPDLRCGDEEICRDPAGCDAPNRAGTCREKVKRWDCCDSHNDCIDGYECRNQDSSLTCPPSSSAVCLAAPIFGEGCWNVEDCPAGLSCYRVWICGCNGKCYFNRQGNCEPPSNCQTNFDCGEGFVCARDPECFLSPCTTAATCNSGGQCQEKVEGGCWTHDECGEGKYCEGLRICPSDTTCTVPDQPGICADRAGLGECCTSFKGCEPGLRCLSPAQRSGCKVDNTSVCVPAVTPGTSCFGDDDCDALQRCEGAIVCPCGVDNCTAEPQPGQCVPR